MIDWSRIRQSLLQARSASTLPPRVKLPMMPLAVTQFSQEAEKPDTSPKKLGAIIETDSGLTAELLKYVNSSAMGLAQKASSVAHAIALLGIKSTKVHLLTTAVQRAMKKRESKLINIDAFWAASLERAILAKEIAKMLKADKDLAFSAALLQDFLLPAVTNDLFPVYFQFTKDQKEGELNLIDHERKNFGWDHAETSAHVMLNWGFPDDLIVCVSQHHRGLAILGDQVLGRTAAAAVAVSALIPGPLRQVGNGLAQLQKLDQMWNAFDLMKMAEIVDAQYKSTSGACANPFSFLRTVQSMSAGVK